MTKKLHIIDYLILFAIVAFAIYFVNQVNLGFNSEPKRTTYPAKFTVTIDDSQEVVTSITEGLRLAETKAFVDGTVTTVHTSKLQDTEKSDALSGPLYRATVTIHAKLTKSGPNYKLGLKDIKVGKTMVFETDRHYLSGQIIDLEIGEANEK